MFIKTCYNINTIKKGANYEKINKCRGGGNLTAPNRGFTLAEVLVTLGIIGVVSAMTVPTLMQNYQRKSYVTQLHKVYNELNQALLQYQTDKNALNLKEAGLTSEDSVYQFLKSYFKIVQDCGTDRTPCFPDEYRKLSGISSKGGWSSKRHVVLASGTAVGTFYRAGEDNIICEFWIDINGQKGPNVVGRDLFALYLYDDASIDDGISTTDCKTLPLTDECRESNFVNYCSSDLADYFHGCFGKILNDNWEMNY